MVDNIRFISKVIAKLNLQKLKSTVRLVHDRSNKSEIGLYFDIIKCAVLYGAGYNDYRYYDFENLSSKQRATYVTRGVNNKVVKLLNNPNFTQVISDKTLFNQKFRDYINKEWLDLRAASVGDLCKFLSGKEFIIAKPVKGSCGKGIEKYRVADFAGAEQIYNELINKEQFLIEEYIVQHPKMQQLYPYSVNTVRIATINHNGCQNVLYAFVRIGNNGAIVDNLNSGGMTAPVNVETGEVTHPGYDKNEKVYFNHPVTGTQIVGFKIPNWQQAKNICLDACKQIEQVGYIGWDVCITPNGVLLIEANEYPGHDILQLPCHLNKNKIGMLPQFKQFIKEL